DPEARGPGGGEGPDADPARDLFLAGLREGDARRGARPEAARQARGREAAGSGPRGAAGRGYARMRSLVRGRRSAAAARRRLVLGLTLGVPVGWLALPASLAAQVAEPAAPEMVIERPDAGPVSVRTSSIRGYAAVSLSTFDALGWSAAEADGRISLALPDGATVALTVGSPFLHWNGDALQLADAPYVEAGQAYVPAQMLTDFLPD